MGTRYRRFTQLPILIQMLARQELTLVGPSTWDDKNDSFFLQKYKEKRQLMSVLAMCFARAAETYHHWRVFAPGPAGVRVSFDPTRLEPALSGVAGLRLEQVKYLKIKELRERDLSVDELPFVKRYPYKPEKEVRLVWESPTEQRDFLSVPFDLNAITDITLSPWLHKSLAPEIRAVLKEVARHKGLRITRSTLVGNDEWMSHADSAT